MPGARLRAASLRDDVAAPDRGVSHVLARLRRLDHLTTTDVEADVVAGRAGDGQERAIRLDLAQRHRPGGRPPVGEHPTYGVLRISEDRSSEPWSCQRRSRVEALPG